MINKDIIGTTGNIQIDYDLQLLEKNKQSKKMIEKDKHPTSNDISIGNLSLSYENNVARLSIKLSNGEVWYINLTKQS